MLSTSGSAFTHWMPPQEPHSGSLSVLTQSAPCQTLESMRQLRSRQTEERIISANGLSTLRMSKQSTQSLAKASGLQSLGRAQDSKRPKRMGKQGANTHCVHLSLLLFIVGFSQLPCLETYTIIENRHCAKHQCT